MIIKLDVILLICNLFLFFIRLHQLHTFYLFERLIFYKISLNFDFFVSGVMSADS